MDLPLATIGALQYIQPGGQASGSVLAASEDTGGGPGGGRGPRPGGEASGTGVTASSNPGGGPGRGRGPWSGDGRIMVLAEAFLAVAARMRGPGGRGGGRRAAATTPRGP